jgi:hypothetical protein
LSVWRLIRIPRRPLSGWDRIVRPNPAIPAGDGQCAKLKYPTVAVLRVGINSLGAAVVIFGLPAKPALRQYLCDVEKGRRRVSPEQAAKFAAAFGHPPNVLVRLAL